MTDSPYKCNYHNINIICINCATATHRKYEKLLDFVKEMAVVTGEPRIYKPEIYTLVFESRALLEEIGELN